MMTLDEVIIGIKEQMGLGDPVLIDALYYLKEYRAILPLVPSLINTALEVQKKGKTIG